MKTYTIIDRSYDYVLIYSSGFAQRISNLARLRKAVRFARKIGFKRG